ncbi:hypothetical protein DFH29DRAFT_1011176 [Suillus ampliporus]|nr:hypothetical protein DFH29DRAFT_1011176 [Suillus ampliporus]
MSTLSLSKTPRLSSFTGQMDVSQHGCTPHTLHRLVLDIVGEKLTDFESSHQLVQSVHDALLAHKDAYEIVKILHWDLSVGNIIVYRGKGILIDWDLAKVLTIQGPRQITHTGTWQFMSAHLVKNIKAIHAVEDDLESSLYVFCGCLNVQGEPHGHR